MMISEFNRVEIHSLIRSLVHLTNQEKLVGKRTKCWLPAFTPFPAIFSKGFFPRLAKARDYVVIGKCIMVLQYRSIKEVVDLPSARRKILD